MQNPETGFDFKTEYLLSKARIQTFPPFLDLSLDNLADIYPHLMIDVDGVLQSFGGSPSNEVLDKLYDAHQVFSSGISLMTNGNNSPILDGIPSHNRGLLRVKQFPGIIKNHLKTVDSNLDPSHVLAIGDGLSDAVAYRIARLGGVGIVKSIESLSPHPWQRRARDTVYGPLLSKAHLLVADPEVFQKHSEIITAS